MTNWREVIEKEGILPNGLSPKAAVTELSEMLRSPEPATRDEMAYVALTRVIPHLESPLRSTSNHSDRPESRVVHRLPGDQGRRTERAERVALAKLAPPRPHTCHTGCAGWQPVVAGHSRFARRGNACCSQ